MKVRYFYYSPEDCTFWAPNAKKPKTLDSVGSERGYSKVSEVFWLILAVGQLFRDCLWDWCSSKNWKPITHIRNNVTAPSLMQYHGCWLGDASNPPTQVIFTNSDKSQTTCCVTVRSNHMIFSWKDKIYFQPFHLLLLSTFKLQNAQKHSQSQRWRKPTCLFCASSLVLVNTGVGWLHKWLKQWHSV